jgi:hypothetical protein
MTNYTWTIVQMNRLTADGFVVTVHYNVSATDGTYNASDIRHCGLHRAAR